jgi:cation diffusion facilitator CzcD-associated flavoprotein CzcO
VRGQQPIDEEWFRSLPPGWQAERTRNFTEVVTGNKPDRDLVGDGWGQVLREDTQREPASEEERARLEQIDFEIMEGFRHRIDEVVEDPETAERLKPWYGKHCKRICFHDEYLQSYNLPNVHLVDTKGKGVEKIVAEGPEVDGVTYPVDLLIYASGFEVTTGLVSRLGFDPKGRDGLLLSERFADGAHTLHGILANGFPNLFICHFVQAGFGLNFTHYLGDLAEHISTVVSELLADDVATIEATVEAEEEWLATLWQAGKAFGRYSATCTPSYGNSEGARTSASARNVVYPGNLMKYMAKLAEWREAGDHPGTVVTHH